jgi:salicylate hydroxylase
LIEPSSIQDNEFIADMSDVRDLEIAIIGSGMGGLGTALALAKRGFKHINVYEAASNLGFVGAGIQMAPNMGRILDRLGCWEGIEKESTCVAGSSIRRIP